MTISQLSELILRNYEGGDYAPTKRYTLREIIFYVKSAFAELLEAKITAEKRQGMLEVDGNLILSYNNLKPTRDTTRNEFYIDLPETPITLPQGMGVFEVSLQEDRSCVIPPIPIGFGGLMKGLDVECMEDQAAYYLENENKLWFHQGEKLSGKRLLVKLVVASDSTECPDSIEGPIFDIVMRRIMNNQREDVINDNHGHPRDNAVN